jgi:hypothetical protein
MTGPAGWAAGYEGNRGGIGSRTRTVCPCGYVTTVYEVADGLYAPGWIITPETTEPFEVPCRGCGEPRTIDPVLLRYAVAERRREFRIR